MNIQGEAAPGKSSGEAMQAMEEIAANYPRESVLNGPGFPIRSGPQVRRRSFCMRSPLSSSSCVLRPCMRVGQSRLTNLFMLPLGVFGATLFTWAWGLHNDVYFQIGFLTTLGLTTKNAILIIQFARERLAHGEGLKEATLGRYG